MTQVRPKADADPELDEFKRNIDLRDFSAYKFGYTHDRKQSWGGSFVMRNAGDDKIVVKRLLENGHYVYFSLRDARDKGSIVEFVRNRTGCNLGEARKLLRGYLGRPSTVPSAYAPLKATTKDRNLVERNYRLMQDAPRHPYLESVRGLSPALLGAERFAGRIKIDARGNAVFPHFDTAGLSGFEMKNHAFTGFATGGQKGLWFSRTSAEDRCLVFAESAIDALSYAALFPDEKARYASIGGQLNPVQPSLISAAILKLPAGSEVIAAMDADAAGVALAALIETAFLETGRSDLTFRIHRPPNEKQDWNDVLRQSRSTSFPVARL